MFLKDIKFIPKINKYAVFKRTTQGITMSSLMQQIIKTLIHKTFLQKLLPKQNIRNCHTHHLSTYCLRKRKSLCLKKCDLSTKKNVLFFRKLFKGPKLLSKRQLYLSFHNRDIHRLSIISSVFDLFIF